MKKEFTTKFIKENSGCYGMIKLETVYHENNKNCFHEEECVVTINEIINSNIPLKDKFWFFIRKTELTIDQKRIITIDLAEIVLPIYEKKYKNDKRPREAIEAAKSFLAGHIELEELLNKKRAAYAAADAAANAAADAAADAAAYAAADAAADAAYAAANAAYAANAAANAAYAANAANAAYAAYAAAITKKQLIEYLINFVNNN